MMQTPLGKDDLTALLDTCETHVNRGEFDQARAICATIFASDPGNLGALTNYVTITPIAAGDPVFDRIRTYADQSALPDHLRSRLFFLLGKGLDDLGDTDAAFDAILQANAFSGHKTDPLAPARMAQRMIGAAQTLDLAPLPAVGPRMVFVLGMPRSGTSLVAQMLGAHPQITNLGEMTALGAALGQIDGQQMPHHQAIAAMTQRHLTAARDTYLDAVAKVPGASNDVLIDKMPENYWFAPLIPLLFPDALILHMRRERIAACWSCFRNDFRLGHRYSYDFPATLAQYDAHIAMCDAANDAAPDCYRALGLTDLVHAPQQQLTPILAALGLPWDDACAAPEKAGGEVKTLSKGQIRAGIQPAIAAGWRAYLPHIQKRWGVTE